MNDAYELWQKSLSLRTAPQRFAEQVYKDEWTASLKVQDGTSGLVGLIGEAQSAAESGLEGWKVAEQAFARFNAKNAPREQLLSRAKEAIVAALRRGDYRGFGFDRPRSLETLPVEIPSACWSGSVIWDANTLRFQSMRFSEVRLRTVPANKDPVLKSLYDEPAPKPGRPSVAPAIKRAAYELYKIGEIDVKASQKSHYPKIRTWLERNEPDLPVSAQGISDKTMHKYFSIIFRELSGKSSL